MTLPAERVDAAHLRPQRGAAPAQLAAVLLRCAPTAAPPPTVRFQLAGALVHVCLPLSLYRKGRGYFEISLCVAANANSVTLSVTAFRAARTSVSNSLRSASFATSRIISSRLRGVLSELDR